MNNGIVIDKYTFLNSKVVKCTVSNRDCKNCEERNKCSLEIKYITMKL